MSDLSTDQAQSIEPETDEDDDGASRSRSTVRFPYGDLDDAVEVAEKVFNKYGGAADFTQLSNALGFKTTNSGAFRSRLSAAKLFGFIRDHESKKRTVTITKLGQLVCDPATRAHARARAFLEVPLYRKVFDDVYPTGGTLPSAASGLESMLEGFGVVPTQTGRARQALLRSAEQAGFRESNAYRLVKPVAFDSVVATDEDGEEPEGGESNEGGDDEKRGPRNEPQQSIGMKPSLVLEMFKQLPDEGTELDPNEFETWLAGFKAVIPIAYKTKLQVRGELTRPDGNGT